MLLDHPYGPLTQLGEYLLGRPMGSILSRNEPSDKPGVFKAIRSVYRTMTIHLGSAALFPVRRTVLGVLTGSTLAVRVEGVAFMYGPADQENKCTLER
jgi:hypothetical protein